MRARSRTGLTAGALAVLACAAGAGCVQILGLEDPVDGGGRTDAAPTGDDATMGPEAGPPGEAGADAPIEAAPGICVPDAPCAPPGTCDQGKTVCDDGGVASCMSTAALPGCEGQRSCDSDGGCVCESTCSSTCVNETNDPTNCGGCGNSCFVGDLAGVCQSSVCQPIQGPNDFGDVGFPVYGIAADGPNIFLAKVSATYGADVGSVDIQAGSFHGYAHDVTQAGQLRVDAQNVYWAEIVALQLDGGAGYKPSSGQISKCPRGSSSPIVLASGQNFPIAIATDATNVYWTNTANTAGPDGQVMKCAIAGCGNNPTLLASGQTMPGGIAVDATNVYWINVGTGAADGAIMSCAISGCGSPTPIATGLATPNEIVVNGTTLYWTNAGTSTAATALVHDGTVMSCPVTGCVGAPSILASGQGNPGGLATDGLNLYWANFGSGSQQQGESGQGGQVMKCAIGGCNGQPTVLQSVQGPTEIAISSTFVTWGDLEGNFWVLPK
jgi:hypothetical protein